MNIFGRKSKKVDSISGNAKKVDPSTNSQKVLGVPLIQAVRNNPSYDGVPVPAIVRECLDHIVLHGLHVEGIYRVSSPKSRLDELEHLTNSGRQNEIIFQDAHEAAGLLKRFLRQLPEHILTSLLLPQFEKVASVCACDEYCKCSAAVKLKEMLLQLPTENFHLLAFVFRNAQMVVQQSSNKMGLAALGVLLQAMLDIKERNLVKIFIENAFCSVGNGQIETQLFDSVDIRPYLKPKNIEELKQNPPTTKKELEDEINKQQNLLEHLHEQIQQMRQRGKKEDTKQKEDQMWNIQTGITLLKRHLKTLQEREHRSTQEGNEKGRIGGSDGEEAEEAGTSNSSPSLDGTGRAVNLALLEKQLLAVQMTLREEIGEEKRQIAHLLSVLRELRNKLPDEERDKLSISQREICEEAQRKSFQLPNCEENWRKMGEDGRLETNTDWEEQCGAEESRREQLLGELIRYRKICAQLRARLEHDTVLLKLKQKQQTLEDGNAVNNSLLVTRF